MKKTIYKTRQYPAIIAPIALKTSEPTQNFLLRVKAEIDAKAIDICKNVIGHPDPKKVCPAGRRAGRLRGRGRAGRRTS
jgi:hypothetical protein